MNRASLEAIARQWRRHRALRHGGLLAAAACAATAVVFPWHPPVAAGVGLATAAVAAIALRRRAPPITTAAIAEHLNRRCPALEESAALWLRDPDDLGVVERLQLRRLNQTWSALPAPPPGLPPSARLIPILLALLLSLAFLGAVVSGTAASRARIARGSPPPIAPAPAPAPASIPTVSATLEIRPPAYLGRPARRVDTLATEVEEGAEVLWNFVTAPHLTGLELSGHGTNDALVAEPLGAGRFRIRREVADTLVYQVAVRSPDGSKVTLPALHVLQVRRDSPPRLVWRSPALPSTSIPPASNLPPVGIEVLASDDHAVAEVRLLLTVAKGSGEGMRFRELSEILPGPSVAESADPAYGRSLDLAALGLEPGDELYLQAVALDTRRPTPNESRTETRRLVLAGPSATTGDPAVVLPGLRRLPQYFRSQRQLVLDTEQLLAERPALSEAGFRARSENLGLDQKLLRLRYGQFLGEEFEPASAGAPREAVAMEWAAALRGPAGQDPDRNAAIGRAIEATHAHEPGPQPAPTLRPGSTLDLFAQFAHNHDSPEAATFLDERLKASLRAVLAAMWEAEGFLRTAQPSAALPAELRALEILKAIQQADRLSVGRVGSELPPLRLEERRLRGELDAVPASAHGTPTASRRVSDPDADALRRAVAGLAGPAPGRIPEELAARVEDRLWSAAQAQPDRYLPALQLWRSRAAPLPSSALDTIRHTVWSLLPPTEESPHRRPPNRPGLDQRYADAVASSSSPPP